MAKKKKKSGTIHNGYSKQQKIKEALLFERTRALTMKEESEKNTTESVESIESVNQTETIETPAIVPPTEEAFPESALPEPAPEQVIEPEPEPQPEPEPEPEPEPKKALLETLWFGLDYGSILNAFALDRTVQSLGWQTSLMNKSPRLWTPHYDDPENLAGKFIYKNCRVENVCHDDGQLRETVDRADAVIIGSDIIWSYDVCTRETGTHYYLDYVPQGKKKLSYATSFGYSYSGPFGEDMKTCARYLSAFDGISVNNYHSLDILHERFGLDGEIVLEPLFLCDPQHFRDAAAQAPCIQDENASSFIFNYIKYGTKRKRQLVLRGNDILTPKHFSPMRNFININEFPESKAMLGLDTAFHITVEDWLYYLINSEFVITDDYYGICFAIIFHKPFIFIESVNYEGIGNVHALLSSLNLDERIVNTEDDFKKKEYLFRMPVRYQKVDRILAIMKQQSLAWLNGKLNDNDIDSENK